MTNTATAAESSAQADAAAVELARLQLSYTVVKAPFVGVVGAKLVFPGAAVKVNETTRAIVNRVRPLYVGFAVPEKYLPQLQAGMRSAKKSLKASITLPGTDAAWKGDVRFLDYVVAEPHRATARRLHVRQRALKAGIRLACQFGELGIAQNRHHGGRRREFHRNPSRRDLAHYRVAWQQTGHITVRDIGLVGEIRVAGAEDDSGNDVLAGLLLDLAVHVDARKNAESLRAQCLDHALDGMVDAIGQLAFEI